MKRRTRFTPILTALILPLALVAAGPAVAAGAQSGEDVTEASITRLTASLLARSQFAHHPLDDKLAGAFLERYLEALDGERSLFLQSDVAEFAADATALARDTRRSGDTRLAHAIFARYLERLEQRTAFVTSALQRETFDFTGNDVYPLDRKNAARPSDAAAARVLWRKRLRFEYLREKLDDKSPQRIADILTRRADRLLQAMRGYSRDAVLEIYLSALAQVYDPHSDYLGREQMEEFAITMNLSLVGIGARLQSEDGRCKIVDLLPGGPAARSGALSPGDYIVAVAQDGEEPVDVVDLPLARTVDLIRGPKGSTVILTVAPASVGDDAVRKTVTLVRDEIKLQDRRAKARIVDVPDGQGTTRRLGIIELPSFYSDLGDERGRARRPAAGRTSAAADVAVLLRKLKAENVRGLILDLRFNGGGSLEEAIDVTGLFIDGPVVQTRGPDGDIEVGTDPDPSVLYDGPLIVLTSRFSASASEIVAGALQDYGRAIVVGDPSTFGKGTVQSVVPLAPLMERSGLPFSREPGALTVTIRKFYRPSGASTQLRGVAPDIVLPSLSAGNEIGESALDNPLPWDTIPAARFDRLSATGPYLDRLRELSARRVAGAGEFAYLRDEIARLARRLQTNAVSLNEAQRRQEIADLEARRKAHETLLRTADSLTPVTYAISVQDATRAGLPPPLERGATAEAGRDVAREPADDTGPGDMTDPSPRHDVILREAQRILSDYVSLMDLDAVPASGRTQVHAVPGARAN